MSKSKVIKHLNELWGFDIDPKIKIKSFRSHHHLSAGACSWYVAEGEFAGILGSTETIKDLSTLLKGGRKLFIHNTNHNFYDITEIPLKHSNPKVNFDYLNNNSDIIFNPYNKDINKIFFVDI